MLESSAAKRVQNEKVVDFAQLQSTEPVVERDVVIDEIEVENDEIIVPPAATCY